MMGERILLGLASLQPAAAPPSGLLAGMCLDADACAPAKNASGKNFCKTRRRRRNFYPQPVTEPQKNTPVYDQHASEPTIYAYVGGNPVNRIDQPGLNNPENNGDNPESIYDPNNNTFSVFGPSAFDAGSPLATESSGGLFQSEEIAAETKVPQASEQCKATAVTTYYPPNNGFLGQPSTEMLQPGTSVERWGYPGGKYLAPAGSNPWSLSLPPGSTSLPYNKYTVLKPFSVTSGPAAPWFGQLGGGMQYLSPKSVGWLIQQGYLK